MNDGGVEFWEPFRNLSEKHINTFCKTLESESYMLKFACVRTNTQNKLLLRYCLYFMLLDFLLPVDLLGRCILKKKLFVGCENKYVSLIVNACVPSFVSGFRRI